VEDLKKGAYYCDKMDSLVVGAGSPHAVLDGGQPRAHVLGVVRFDDVLHVVFGAQDESVFPVGHLQGSSLARLRDQETENAALRLRCLQTKTQTNYLATNLFATGVPV
jgi:hypothetical protein